MTFSTRATGCRSQKSSRALVLLLLALVATTGACGNDPAGPVGGITGEEAALASVAIFSRTVSRSIELFQEPTADDVIVDLDCEISGTARVLTFVAGTVDSGAGTASLLYDLGINHSECVESGGASPEIELNATTAARGIVGEADYQLFANGDIEVEGFLVGEVEVSTASSTLNCRYRGNFAGQGHGEGRELEYRLVGNICGVGFDIAL